MSRPYALVTSAIVAGSALIAAIAIAASGGDAVELVLAIATTVVFLAVVGVRPRVRPPRACPTPGRSG